MAIVVETQSTSAANGGLYRMSVEVFLRAVEADVFPESDHVFLRDGQIFTKMAKKLPHSVASAATHFALSRVLPDGWCLWHENPILTSDFSAPLPDLCVVRGMAQDYFRRNSFPRAEDIGLVIEIADHSLREDRTDSLVEYATAGLPVYWLVNLVDWCVEVYSNPESAAGTARFLSRDVYVVGHELPLILEGVEIARVPVLNVLPGERRAEP